MSDAVNTPVGGCELQFDGLQPGADGPAVESSVGVRQLRVQVGWTHAEARENISSLINPESYSVHLEEVPKKSDNDPAVLVVTIGGTKSEMRRKLQLLIDLCPDPQYLE